MLFRSLWDALKRAYLVDDRKGSLDHDGSNSSGASTPVNRFTLDSPVEDEGSNLSVGQVRVIYKLLGMTNTQYPSSDRWFHLLGHWSSTLKF